MRSHDSFVSNPFCAVITSKSFFVTFFHLKIEQLSFYKV